MGGQGSEQITDYTDIIRRCDLFRELEESVIEEVLGRMVVRTYSAGTSLIRKGFLPEELFVLCSGRTGIYNADVLLTELRQPAMLGEGLLIGSPANATATTLESSAIASIARQDFLDLCHSHPAMLMNVLLITNRRLTRSNDKAMVEAHSREQVLRQLVEERTAELHHTLDQLQETQKFRDQFLANMSHEIRTPMNAIVGLTHLLLKTPLNPQQEKYLRVIRQSGDNLLVIINDILDQAKLEAGKMELEQTPFDLHAALGNVLTVLSLKAEEKGIALNASLDPDLPQYVLGDVTRLTQILMNLAGNAIKFTSEGSVTLETTTSEQQPEDVLIRFCIRDTGIGIPADKLEHIFESFGQAGTDTTRKFGGTGLGLSISRQLVQLHGAELQVESTPGQGSAFFFSIRYPRTEAPKSTVAEEHASTALQGVRILLVEDNEFNQMVAVDTLKDLFEGLEVDVAADGNEALEKAQAAPYQLIFMDIELPGMDGYETTRQLRASTKENLHQIPICAMTASVTRDRIEACMASGMNDYLLKPFRPDDLREKVLRLVAG